MPVLAHVLVAVPPAVLAVPVVVLAHVLAAPVVLEVQEHALVVLAVLAVLVVLVGDQAFPIRAPSIPMPKKVQAVGFILQARRKMTSVVAPNAKPRPWN